MADPILRLSHQQRSMIASAIAGRQPLCCRAGKRGRETISVRAAIAELAYERAGCWPDAPDYVRELWLSNILDNLTKETP